jgi:flavin reductase (DIM6/NTAB) family NADH-FMN oxidoreductase RutF
MAEPIDPRHFRHVLGHFPTGVVAVTSRDDSGAPIGMIVGSFTSVSLEPPLVAFLPARKSTTAPKILAHGRFCVNVLGAHQEEVSRAFTTAGAGKFDHVDWTWSSSGLPHLNGAIARIECTVQTVHDAGDHQIVVGQVVSLEAPGAALPLVFFQSGYGRFAPQSFAAAAEPDLVEHLRLVDLARPHMEEIASRYGIECLASSPVGEEIVLLATAGRPSGGRAYSRVGQRLPHIPPLGAALVAWSESATNAWIARTPGPVPDRRRHELERLAGRVRRRGFSMSTWSDNLRRLEAMVDRTTLAGLTPHGREAVVRLVEQLGAEHEPEEIPDRLDDHYPRNVSVPVFDQRRDVVMQVTAYDLPPGPAHTHLDRYLEPLTELAERVSAALADSATRQGAVRQEG